MSEQPGTAPPPGGQAQEDGMREAAMFAQGARLGTEWVRKTSVQVKAWAEDNPGQAVLVALGAGFLLGKLLFGRRREKSNAHRRSEIG